MFDIKELEKKWLIFKIKSYLPHAATIIAVASTLILLNHMWEGDTNSKEQLIAQESNNSVAITADSSIEIDDKHNLTNNSIDITPDNNDITIEPSMDFVAEITISAPTANQSPQNNSHITNSIITPKALELPPPPAFYQDEPTKQITNTVVKTEEVKQKSTQNTLAIKRSENKVNIDELHDRFKDSSNANLGLFIAKYHYDNGNFNEAYNYSLKTNAINSKLDESWIIFCKSLVKLGKKEQARRTLVHYIKESRSDEAIVLLDSIDKGTFK